MLLRSPFSFVSSELTTAARVAPATFRKAFKWVLPMNPRPNTAIRISFRILSFHPEGDSGPESGAGIRRENSGQEFGAKEFGREAFGTRHSARASRGEEFGAGI